MTGRVVRRLRDVLRDVTVELHARRSRTVLMILAVAMSMGALLTASAVSATAARQVDADLAASTLRLILVKGNAAGTEPTSELPPDSEARAERLDTVEHAGMRLDVSSVTSAEVARGGLPAATPGDKPITVTAVTSAYLRASDTTVSAPTAWVLDTDRPVAFMGVGAAARLDIPTNLVPTGYTVTINGQNYSIAGFVDSGAGALAESIVIPYACGVALAGSDTASELLVETAPGAGAVTSTVIRTAIRPDAPERLTSSQVVDVADLRTGVSTQLDRLAAWIGGLLLALTTLLIANAMIVSVTSRTAEIGLRRAMGTTRRSVAALFLTEAGICGLLGGLTGSALAASATVAVAIVNDWSAVLNLAVLGTGPIVGALAGIVSAAYPALHATTIEPAQAVRTT